MNLTPLQMPSVNHNPSCDGLDMHVMVKRIQKDSMVEKHIAKERLSVIYI